jgi:hypothetical protein
MKKSKKSKLVPFVYEGITDMDDCLFAKDSDTIIPIEAKIKHIPDLSWHKLAFPCYRFIRRSSNEMLESPQGDRQLGRSNKEEKWKLFFSSDPLDLKPDSSDKLHKIIPVYCTCIKEYDSWKRGAILYVFPKIATRAGRLPSLSWGEVRGLILNDEDTMKPEHIFRVDLGWLRKA